MRERESQLHYLVSFSGHKNPCLPPVSHHHFFCTKGMQRQKSQTQMTLCLWNVGDVVHETVAACHKPHLDWGAHV